MSEGKGAAVKTVEQMVALERAAELLRCAARDTQQALHQWRAAGGAAPGARRHELETLHDQLSLQHSIVWQELETARFVATRVRVSA